MKRKGAGGSRGTQHLLQQVESPVSYSACPWLTVLPIVTKIWVLCLGFHVWGPQSPCHTRATSCICVTSMKFQMFGRTRQHHWNSVVEMSKLQVRSRKIKLAQVTWKYRWNGLVVKWGLIIQCDWSKWWPQEDCSDIWNQIFKHHSSLYWQKQSVAKAMVVHWTQFPNDSTPPECQWYCWAFTGRPPALEGDWLFICP